MFWGGLRGAIPLALALGLPADFEHRVMIIDLTLGVVLMSLLIQGTTVGWLLKKLKLIGV
jgi:CPA1 family monovalent cation:H+ antiporter